MRILGCLCTRVCRIVLIRWNIKSFRSEFKRRESGCWSESITLVLLLNYAAVSVAFAEFDRIAQPVDLIGRGLSGVGSENPESLLLNPASIASSLSLQSTLFYSPSPFGLQQLSNGGIFLTIPSRYVNSALTLASIGFSAYREVTGTVSVGVTIAEGFFAGCNLNINHLSIEGYGSGTNAGIDIGMRMRIVDNFQWGFSLLNVNRPTIGRIKDPLPQWYLAGFKYEVSPFADISVDAVKDVRYPLSFRMGTQFLPVEFVAIRLGISSDPSRYYAGVGLQYADLHFDYAVVTHTELGLSHSLGFTFGL